MSNLYIAIISNFTPVTILKSKAKEAAAFIISKVIYSSLSTSNNGKAPIEIYIISPRRLKEEVKIKINIEKLFKIIINTRVKGVIVKNLIANCLYMYRTFFGK
jgi:hypothetical protein